MKKIFAVLCAAVCGCAQLPDVPARDALTPGQREFKEKLRAFSARRYALAKDISEKSGLPIPPEAHEFFKAAISGSESDVKTRADALHEDIQSYMSIPELRNALWATAHETMGVYVEIWEEWKKDVFLMRLFYEPILSAMPPGSVYFGGTDLGRFLPTLMNEVEDAGIFCLT